jgi:hypothetical protein
MNLSQACEDGDLTLGQGGVAMNLRGWHAACIHIEREQMFLLTGREAVFFISYLRRRLEREHLTVRWVPGIYDNLAFNSTPYTKWSLSTAERITNHTDREVSTTPEKALKIFIDLPGRAIPQAVSHWLPTAAARVRARDRSCGICGGQSGTGEGFVRVLRFPLPIFIPHIASQSPSSIIWGWHKRPILAAVPSYTLTHCIREESHAKYRPLGHAYFILVSS